MRIGLGPLALSDFAAADLKQLAKKAESAGYDSIWVSESRGRGAGGALAAASFLGELVAIRIGAVVQAGLFHPLHLAEDIAVADVATGGRIEVAIVQGDALAAGRYGVPQSAARLAEEVGVVRTAMSGVHFRHEGRYYRIPANLPENGTTPSRLAINPPPVQPSVPIWLDAEMPRAATLARRNGFGLLVGWNARNENASSTGSGLPTAILTPPSASVADISAAADAGMTYFLVGAGTPIEVEDAGRRLMAALRMPGPPAWVTAD
jgi:alkanesulfonate monooxygenase SsuD/methylene tetrahydromethanopterin reductase-like flavin-dependent oxidoreductase (luciferase family)